MLIGYERVSTDDQNLALQHDALLAAGCEKIFSDKMSGVKTDRHGLKDAFAFARKGDTIVVWRPDRLGPSLKDLIALVEELETRKIGFRSLQESIDTTTSGGKLIFHLFGALAEFERNLIRERTQAGSQAARARGRKGGPWQKLTPQQIEIGRSLALDSTRSVSSICDHLSISRPTFYRYIHPLGKPEPISSTTQVRLWLRVENNSKLVRRKQEVREWIEQSCLSPCQMKKQSQDGWDYELTIPYDSEPHLDQQINDLLDDMATLPELENCFIETDITEIGTELVTSSTARRNKGN
jgi:DNA invertase Pin-like site-specific DNA recombinase